jgi:hypothetical protein
MSISIKFATLTVLSTFILAGCSPTIVDYSSGTDTTPSPKSDIDLGEGDDSGTIQLPDFNSAGEEGEVSDAAWNEFYDITIASGDALLADGALEYYEMFEEQPYIMISVPDSELGSFWNIYSNVNEKTYSIAFDTFSMSPLSSYLDLMRGQGDKEVGKTLTTVSKNEDRTFTITRIATGEKRRYKVQGGVISGVAVFAEDELFLGYSSVYYETDAALLTTVNEVYQSGIDAGEEFVGSEYGDRIKALFVAPE